jgi:hypothetical protein
MEVVVRNEIVVRHPPANGGNGQTHDALRDYLDAARAWERMPSLVNRDLSRLGIAASLINVAVGTIGWLVQGSQLPAGFFMIAASTIISFMQVFLTACPFIAVVGALGFGVCGLAAVRPSGLWLRVLIGIELIAAGTALACAVILVAAVVVQTLVWLVLIAIVVSLCGLFLGAFLAGALDG